MYKMVRCLPNKKATCASYLPSRSRPLFPHFFCHRFICPTIAIKLNDRYRKNKIWKKNKSSNILQNTTEGKHKENTN